MLLNKCHPEFTVQRVNSKLSLYKDLVEVVHGMRINQLLERRMRAMVPQGKLLSWYCSGDWAHSVKLNVLQKLRTEFSPYRYPLARID